MDSMDTIFIRDLEARCIIGVREWERREKQLVTINLTLWTDLRPAGRSDRLEDTVDYSRLKKDVLTLVEESSCNLIEALAERIAALCLRQPEVSRVRVRLEKPGAIRFAAGVGVELTRGRE